MAKKKSIDLSGVSEQDLKKIQKIAAKSKRIDKELEKRKALRKDQGFDFSEDYELKLFDIMDKHGIEWGEVSRVAHAMKIYSYSYCYQMEEKIRSGHELPLWKWAGFARVLSFITGEKYYYSDLIKPKKRRTPFYFEYQKEEYEG